MNQKNETNSKTIFIFVRINQISSFSINFWTGKKLVLLYLLKIEKLFWRSSKIIIYKVCSFLNSASKKDCSKVQNLNSTVRTCTTILNSFFFKKNLKKDCSNHNFSSFLLFFRKTVQLLCLEHIQKCGRMKRTIDLQIRRNQIILIRNEIKELTFTN